MFHLNAHVYSFHCLWEPVWVCGVGLVVGLFACVVWLESVWCDVVIVCCVA